MKSFRNSNKTHKSSNTCILELFDIYRKDVKKRVLFISAHSELKPNRFIVCKKIGKFLILELFYFFLRNAHTKVISYVNV